MCECNPNIRTMYCGLGKCQWPKMDVITDVHGDGENEVDVVFQEFLIGEKVIYDAQVLFVDAAKSKIENKEFLIIYDLLDSHPSVATSPKIKNIPWNKIYTCTDEIEKELNAANKVLDKYKCKEEVGLREEIGQWKRFK